MSLFLSGVALASGVFIVIAPGRAARIWGWENFETLTPTHKRWYLRSFRFMGTVIALGGILNAVDSILFH